MLENSLLITPLGLLPMKHARFLLNEVIHSIKKLRLVYNGIVISHMAFQLIDSLALCPYYSLLNFFIVSTHSFASLRSLSHFQSVHAHTGHIIKTVDRLWGSLKHFFFSLHSKVDSSGLNKNLVITVISNVSCVQNLFWHRIGKIEKKDKNTKNIL